MFSKYSSTIITIILFCIKCEENIGEAEEQEEKLCDYVETVREFTHLGNRVSTGGGCEAVVTK